MYRQELVFVVEKETRYTSEYVEQINVQPASCGLSTLSNGFWDRFPNRFY